MKNKNYLLTAVSILLTTTLFAYPVPPDDDPTQQLLQQYAAQAEQMQKDFDQYLLPPLKNIATLALSIHNAGQEELTGEQKNQFTQYFAQLDMALTQVLAPILQDFDLAQFNAQYKQMAQLYGLPEQEFTMQTVTDLFKGVMLIGALGYFEQTQKLTNDEIEMLAALLLPQEEAPAQ